MGPSVKVSRDKLVAGTVVANTTSVAAVGAASERQFPRLIDQNSSRMPYLEVSYQL